LASRVANWLPKYIGILFLRHLGQYKAIKNFNKLYGLVLALLYTKAIKFFKVNWGHFEKVFKIFSL